MSDLMAAMQASLLPGKAGLAAIQANAAGKPDLSDPFLAMLFAKLNPEVGLDPSESASLLAIEGGEAGVEVDVDDVKLRAEGLLQAMQQAAPLPAEVAVQQAMLAVPGMTAQPAVKPSEFAQVHSQAFPGEGEPPVATVLSGEDRPTWGSASSQVVEPDEIAEMAAQNLPAARQVLPSTARAGEGVSGERGLQTAVAHLPVQVFSSAMGSQGAAESVGALQALSQPLTAPAQPQALMPQAWAQPDAAVRGTGWHLAVDAPLRSAQFAQELGDRVVWMAGRQGQVAEIALNPPHLGPLEVRLSLQGGEAGAQFYSPHAPVREALEAALPKLRDMLADAGITLGQASVREESLTRRQAGEGGQSDAQAEGDPGAAQQGALPLGAPPATPVRRGLGLVDLYV